MKKNRIRPLAICVFRRGRRILVAEGYDPTKKELFHRPLGGAIHFGERSAEALRREVREELGAEVRNMRFLGVLENLFTFDGEAGHEVVFVFDARFRNRALYSRRRLTGRESDGVPFRAVWRDIEVSQDGLPPLYPDGLLELLRRS